MNNHCKSYPWTGNDEMETQLSNAAQRYAILIGVTSNPDIPLNLLNEDRERFKHMIKTTEEGLPIWDDCIDGDAVNFVHEVTGLNKRICTQWLRYDWPESYR